MEQPSQSLPVFANRATNRLKAFPTGWFLISFSDELKPGEIRECKFMGQDLVLFRTESGQACVTDAFCPHMGAHFAYGGEVQGEIIRCPFHGFCYDTEGACVKTGYGTKPPRKAQLRTWPIREMNGIILVWHHQDGLPPSFEVAELDDKDWTPLIHHEWEVQANPYDTAENSVDFGHFAIVHGYEETKILEPLHLDGPLLKAKYAMDRNAGLFAKKKNLTAEFEITKYGLGYSVVEVEVAEFGLRSRHFVFGSAMDESTSKLRVAISLKHVAHPEKINPILKLIPKSWLHRIILSQSMRGYKNDVEQDFEIWRNKIGIERPPLAEGDGPIIPFRRWTKQFDPTWKPERETIESDVVPAAE